MQKKADKGEEGDKDAKEKKADKGEEGGKDAREKKTGKDKEGDKDAANEKKTGNGKERDKADREKNPKEAKKQKPELPDAPDELPHPEAARLDAIQAALSACGFKFPSGHLRRLGRVALRTGNSHLLLTAAAEDGT